MEYGKLCLNGIMVNSVYNLFWLLDRTRTRTRTRTQSDRTVLVLGSDLWIAPLRPSQRT